MADTISEPPSVSMKDIAAHCKTYKGADAKRSIFQLTTTLALFTVACGLMFFSINISYWITALLAIPTGGLLVRIFIFQHDCGHRSFFNSKKANDWTGRILSILTFTPYDFWRRAHNKHHATSGDLDRRSIGAIDTITVREYQALSNKRKIIYRIYRNPLFLLILGTPIYMIIAQRIPFNQITKFHENYQTLPVRSIWKSIMLTNLSIVIFFGTLSLIIGFGTLIAIYLPILLVTSWVGGWLFFVQHQFEDAYWERNENWSTQEAALNGSSYYALPKVLQWFAGNVGLHHIHHLCSQIPNYKLQDCMNDKPILKDISKLTFYESLQCTRLKLWDEQKNKLVSIPRT